jgi:hypothetical protein
VGRAPLVAAVRLRRIRVWVRRLLIRRREVVWVRI